MPRGCLLASGIVLLPYLPSLCYDQPIPVATFWGHVCLFAGHFWWPHTVWQSFFCIVHEVAAFCSVLSSCGSVGQLDRSCSARPHLVTSRWGVFLAGCVLACRPHVVTLCIGALSHRLFDRICQWAIYDVERFPKWILIHSLILKVSQFQMILVAYKPW